jgi:phosphate starvation-inducible protein PhoH and related proteins
MAGTTGLEPATSDVTGRRSNQLNYVPAAVQVGDLRIPHAPGSDILKADVASASASAEVRLPGPLPLAPRRMKSTVQIRRGIESLFGTRDENIRLIEKALGVRTRLLNDSLEVEGDEAGVRRATEILGDYASLVQEGHQFNNGDLNSFLRVVTADAGATLRGLVESGKQRSFGKKAIAPKSMMQRRYLDAIERYDLVFGIGPAGTGKTYLAVAMAVSALLSKRVSRIILTRPAVEAGERLGFLPGTFQEKVDPYLRPLYDALYDMLEADKVEKLLERNVIEVAPIAFMRGRTLNDSFIIMDEAQNTTPEQMKMILTRQGFNSKMVVTGDITQVDLPMGQRSGLIEVADVLRGVEGIAFVQFDERDVVRHSLVQKIVKAYERYNEAIGANRQLSLRLAEPPAEAPAAPARELQGGQVPANELPAGELPVA